MFSSALLYARKTVLELVIGLETAKGGAPKDPLALAYIVREFDGELRLAQPPYPLQRLLFGPLAALARAVRYPQRLQARARPLRA